MQSCDAFHTIGNTQVDVPVRKDEKMFRGVATLALRALEDDVVALLTDVACLHEYGSAEELLFQLLIRDRCVCVCVRACGERWREIVCAKGREGERERGRGREGERERWRDGERERGRERD